MFKSLPCLPEDPTFKLFNQFKADANPKKVNLGIGLYFDREGMPKVFDTVKKAVSELDVNNFNYLPIGGDREFLRLAGEFVFGEVFDPGRLAMQATCGGTQACRCFADLSLEVLHEREIQIAEPTWVNYHALFGAMKISRFNHCGEDGMVNAEAYYNAARNAPIGSAFLIQGGLAHNPTGVNLSLEQMEELIRILEERRMILFMDMAYLGFGEGIEQDRKYVQLCYEKLERFAVAISFSKNASMYEQRCGALFVKTVNGPCTESQLQKSIRETISTPPGFGQEVMANILKNYRQEWEAEVEAAREDIDWRRNQLVDRLPAEFMRVRETRGMFGLLPLSREQALRLREEFSIYILDNGRVNFAGVKACDLDYIAEGVRSVK